MSGHIKKRTRADGTVTYQARIPTPGNRHKHDVKTFTRKKDAERWLSNEQAKRLTGAYIEPRRGDTPARRGRGRVEGDVDRSGAQDVRRL